MSLSPTISTGYSKHSMGLPGFATVSSSLQRTATKLFASRSWRRISHIYRKLVRAFTLHPAQTQETYLQHLWFTVKTSLKFVGVGVLLLTHGIFPFLFTRTASSQIERLYLLMRSRIPQARRQAIEIEYDI